MSGLLEEREVRSLLERATGDLSGVTGAGAPLAAVLEGGRRRRRTARLRASAVIGAAAAAVVTIVAVQWGSSPASVAPAAGSPVIDPAAGTVQLGGVTVKVPAGWRVDDDGACAEPRTVVVLRYPGVTGCGSGPSLVVSRMAAGNNWQVGKGALALLGGAPVFRGLSYYSDDAAMRTVGATVLSAPYSRTFVTVVEPGEQLDALLAGVSIGQPSAPEVLVSPTPDAAVVQSYSDRGGVNRLITAGGNVAAAVAALEAAPAVPAEEWCVPDPAKQVEVTLKISARSDQDTEPVGDFTSFVTAFSGDCRLAFSSTGAVVKPGPAFFEALGGPPRR